MGCLVKAFLVQLVRQCDDLPTLRRLELELIAEHSSSYPIRLRQVMRTSASPRQRTIGDDAADSQLTRPVPQCRHMRLSFRWW